MSDIESAMRHQAEEVLKEELTAGRQRIIDHMTAAGQMSSGATADSMVVSTEEIDGGFVGTLDARAFFGALETGSKPWENPYYRTTASGKLVPSPPKLFIDVIEEWVTRKGIDIPAAAIAVKLMIEGSALYREGGREDIFSNEIPIITQNVANRIAGIFETQMIDSILRTLNE